MVGAISPAAKKVLRRMRKEKWCGQPLRPAIAMQGSFVRAMSGDRSTFPAADGAIPRGTSGI